MKKFIVAMMTCLFMVFSLFGCSPANEQESDSNQAAQSENDSSTSDQEENQTSIPEDNNSDSNTDSTNKTESDDSNQDDNSDSNQTPNTQQRISRLYYYDIEQNQMFYVDKEVDVIENAYVNALTEALKENQDNKDFVTINEDTFVTSATLDEESGILNIYFNESFHLSTNLGSGIEAGFIDALVNTYGYNYNVDKVALYVQNKLYEDQRGPMPDGYFKVTAEDAVKYE